MIAMRIHIAYLRLLVATLVMHSHYVSSSGRNLPTDSIIMEVVFPHPERNSSIAGKILVIVSHFTIF